MASEHRKKYQRDWVAERRKEFYKDKECEKCGSKENLILHHLDPETKESHRIWSWSEERRLKEIAKCVVWCNDCHIRFHFTEGNRSNGRKNIDYHGTVNGYQYYKCRCEACKKAKSDSKKDYRRRRKLGLIK